MEDVEHDEWNYVTEGEIMVDIKEINNWKSPVVDIVQNYWIKHLKALHPIWIEAINQIKK